MIYYLSSPLRTIRLRCRALIGIPSKKSKVGDRRPAGEPRTVGHSFDTACAFTRLTFLVAVFARQLPLDIPECGELGAWSGFERLAGTSQLTAGNTTV